MVPISQTPVPNHRKDLSDTLLQADHVTHFPPEISALIAAYMDPYLRALEALTFYGNGTIREPEVRAAIKAALMSSDCDQLIKITIFQNIPKVGDANYQHYEKEFQSICSEIIQEEYRINLDGIHLKNVYLFGLDFTKITARGSTFVNVEFSRCNFTKGDLTNATFINCKFSASKMYGVDTRGVRYEETTFVMTHVTDMIIDDPSFKICCALADLEHDDGIVRPTIYISATYPRADLILMQNFMISKGHAPQSKESADIVLSVGLYSVQSVILSGKPIIRPKKKSTAPCSIM